VSSWSCSHGVGRWCEDCGCSTGGQAGWNQKWRAPVREAMDFLRDKVTPLFNEYGRKYFYNSLEARYNYIDVILDRSYSNVKRFQDEYFLPDLSEQDKVKAMKLLEIQRQAMLMYTSCGWFFCEVSGIETVQIMKYAARVIQLAKDFTDEDFESDYLKILSRAQSNYKEIGSGRDIYEKYVRPSIITERQVVSLWAVSSLYQDMEQEEDVYCYTTLYSEMLKYNQKLLWKNTISYLPFCNTRAEISIVR
jgi:alpha-amylase/alpha-mannosidase (GH57 family)